MPTINIVSRLDPSTVLYAHETTDDRQASGMATRDALEAAVKAGANLAGAYLAGANLAGANLAGAYLAGANLADANLAGAYLVGAYLADAYLAGAKLRIGLIAVGSRPLLQIGPIGSRCATLSLWLTDNGPYIQAGCFWGTRDEFEVAVARVHCDTPHGNEYTAALVLIDAHTSLWMPAETGVTA